MSFEGQAVRVLPLDDGLVELRFDLPGESVNKFDTATIGDAFDLPGRGVFQTTFSVADHFTGGRASG